VNVLKLFLCGWILVGTTTALAQISPVRTSNSYGEGRLQFLDGEVIRFDSLLLENNRAIYLLTDPDSEEAIAVSELAKIEIQMGNRARQGLTGGILIGLAGGLLGTAGWNRSTGPGTTDRVVRRSIVLLSGAGCGIIGWLVGSFFETYETIHNSSTGSGMTFTIVNRAPAGTTVAIRFSY